MIDYSWVPWFKDLVTRIVEGGEGQLAERAHEVAWGKENPPLLAYDDKNIDPFSFLYFLAQRNTTHQYDPVFRSVHDVFGIESDFSEKKPFIPTPTSNSTVLFHNGKEFNPGLLWRLFRQAVPTARHSDIQAEDFNAVLNCPGVAIVKLTQTLFIVNPSYFLPVDRNIDTVLSQFQNPQRRVQDYKGYVAMMNAIKRLFPGCEPYEINTFLDTQKKRPLITGESDFFQVSTNVYDDGKDYWERTDQIEGV